MLLLLENLSKFNYLKSIFFWRIFVVTIRPIIIFYKGIDIKKVIDLQLVDSYKTSII